jgi:hypothetical protein
MSPRPRRLVRVLPFALLITACAPLATPSSSGAASVAAGNPAPSEGPASSPAGSADTASSSSPTADQSDTEWGRIWDAVPAGFPRYPGSTPADDASDEPASARYAIYGGDPATVASWYQDALEQATFSTVGMNGPGEDGGFVIESVGDGDCRIQTTIAPLGGMTFVAIWYGAGCPSA